MKKNKESLGAKTQVNYIASALKYLFRNFIFIFVFALIPSYFFAMTADMKNMAEITDKIFALDADFTFGQIFTFLSPINARRWVFALICFASLAVCLPMLLGFIEKHMRIGSRSFKGVAGRFNHNFLTTLSDMLILLAVYELWAVIASGLIYAETLLLGGIACYAVALATYLGMVALMCYLASIFLLWLPCLQITGYNFVDALSYCNQLYVKKRAKLFLAVFVPCLAGVVLQFAVAGLNLADHVRFLAFVLMELIYLFLILYYCILMFVSYFDMAGEERMDLKKKF